MLGYRVVPVGLPTAEEAGMAGLSAVVAARRRQLSGGFTVAHDVEHCGDGQLLDAAWCYLGDVLGAADHFEEPVEWPWPGGVGGCRWKPSPHDPIHQLAKAAALIAAEIDRLTALRD